MRICFVSRRYFPAISGMSVYAQNLLKELVAMNHDVVMISQYRGDEAGTRVYGGGPPPEVPGVKVIGLEARGEQDGGDFERDIEEIVSVVEWEHAEKPFDILHAQYGYPTGLAALEASRRTGLPNLVSIQGGDGHWVGTCCGTHKRAMQAVLGHAGALLIGSRSFAREVGKNNGTNTERFTIVPGAVDVSRFRPQGNKVPGELSPEGPRLLYHGRVDARKGALVLLDAFRGLLGAELPARPRLVYSGIGPDLGRVRKRIAELDLAEEVDVLGYTPYGDAPGVYREGDLFVSPTYAEGFSNTILEAMASGLPVVSTRSVGVVDCLRHEENALLTEVGDAAGLRDEIHRILTDHGLRHRLAAVALEEVRRVYSWPAVARQIVGVYKELVGTEPDTRWKREFPVEPCRFREEPHLL
ncbi:glycosyltransferase family 4 protein [Rubrobacter indicoceani]|uniref:glycosyltransferase family 4 protein n=1 Tax=Rubrobacter indicoceani TaxID=2051957 RepID=UPI000E5AFCA3|nr:glycosyltransferase family 4 protein [Rubrobacter indicoceani]